MSKKEPTKGDKKPKMLLTGKTIDWTIEVPLSDKAKVVRADRAIALLHKIDDFKKQAKAKALEFKSLIEDLDVQARKYFEEFETGNEKKIVKAAERINYTTNRVEFIWQGKIVETQEIDYDAKTEKNPKAAAKVANDVKGNIRQARLKQAIGEDVTDVIRQATNKKTAHSAADGVAGPAITEAQ